MSLEVVKQATLVFFGGTGDLASRKLIPSLYSNWKNGRLEDCLIIGVGRRCANVEEYMKLLDQKVDVAKKEPEEWKEFSRFLGYHQGEIETVDDFKALRVQIEKLEAARNLPGHRLFYFAVGPNYFAPIAENLNKVGLLEIQNESHEGPWTRIIVEKPFGHDGASARELDRRLQAVASESQIFRIDHYLGKETVQNLMALRFANGLFEPIWNNKYIEHVQITVAESLGVGGRGGYYDSSGALRDMMLNHMTQLLALIAMEPPISLEPNAIRDEKVKVLRAIRRPKTPQEVQACTVRGQYGPGKIAGESVPGYREEQGVNPESITPSYVAARIFLDNWRWAHVPFYMRHGKRLAKRGTEIAIRFKTPPLALFRGTDICGKARNELVLRIQPNEGIELHFAAKEPGAGMKISNVKMDFEYQEEFHREIPEAYERLILDALIGDPTLFTRSDEVQAQWRWADSVLKGWDESPAPNFPNYPAGSWGPSEAEDLFPQSSEITTGTCPVSWRRW